MISKHYWPSISNKLQGDVAESLAYWTLDQTKSLRQAQMVKREPSLLQLPETFSVVPGPSQGPEPRVELQNNSESETEYEDEQVQSCNII